LRLEPLEHALDLLFVELELVSELVQLGQLNAAVLLAVGEEQRKGVARLHSTRVPRLARV